MKSSCRNNFMVHNTKGITQITRQLNLLRICNNIGNRMIYPQTDVLLNISQSHYILHIVPL